MLCTDLAMGIRRYKQSDRVLSGPSASIVWGLVVVLRSNGMFYVLQHISGLILGLRPANGRRRYFVTPSPIGWEHLVDWEPGGCPNIKMPSYQHMDSHYRDKIANGCAGDISDLDWLNVISPISELAMQKGNTTKMTKIPKFAWLYQNV